MHAMSAVLVKALVRHTQKWLLSIAYLWNVNVRIPTDSLYYLCSILSMGVQSRDKFSNPV